MKRSMAYSDCSMNTGASKQKLRRVFFALWPDDTVRQQLSLAFKQSPYAHAEGRRYLDSNLHITLHFLGNITEERLNCVKQQAMAIKIDPFVVSINRFGRFKRAGILWLGPEQVPAELTDLHLRLGAALDVCGYTPEDREYRPHITLMRKFHGDVDKKDSAKGVVSVEWAVDRFALIESVSVNGSVEYHPLQVYAGE